MTQHLQDIPGSSVTSEHLFAEWQIEHRDLLRAIDSLRQWMRDVGQLDQPQYGETANQLTMMRDRLLHHFGRVDELGRKLHESEAGAELEIEAICRQADRDHQLLLRRLDDLRERLSAIESPYGTWQAAVDDVELYIDLLEDHEEQQSDCILCWMGRGPCAE